MDTLIFESSHHSFTYDSALLVNLFFHKKSIAVFLCRDFIKSKCICLDFLLFCALLKKCYFPLFDIAVFAVFKIINLFCFADDRRIGGGKIYLFAIETDQKWRAVFCKKYSIGSNLTDKQYGIGTLKCLDSLFKCFKCLLLFGVVLLKEMDDNLCVCLTQKVDAVLLESFFDLLVVFDDAVVNNKAIFPQVRMCVQFCRFAMCCPSRMAYTDTKSATCIVFCLFLEIFEFADCFETCEFIIFYDGDAGTIIPTIFELA